MLNLFQHLFLTMLVALFCITFTGCENFVKGSEIKKELDERIAYANAESFTIVVQADKGSGDILRPLGGEVSKKVTDTFTISFDTAEDYIFMGWEVSSDQLPEGADINDYISLEDPSSLETKVTFKKELKNVVIKAVSIPIPSAGIYVDGSNGKLSPSKGTHTFKQNNPTFISFEPDTDYAFITRKVYNARTKEELPDQEYVVFDDVTEETTNCTLVNPLPEDLILCIKPYVKERPQVLSYWPMYDTAEGALSDTTIEIVFDHEMDPGSILYDDQEIADLEEEYAQEIAQGTFHFKDSSIYDGKAYGYQVGDKIILKNIEIVDKRESDENKKHIEKYFGEPVFEDPTTIYIPVIKPDKITTGMIIIVSANKEFYYTDDVTKKPVTMTKSEKWRYLSNGATDGMQPVVNGSDAGNDEEVTTLDCTISGKKNGADKDYPAESHAALDLSNDADWTWLENHGYFTDNSSVKFTPGEITITDSGSYPTTKFTLEYTKIYDENYNRINNPKSETLTLDYDYALGNTARYSGTQTLKNLADGVYAVRYIFKDRSDNARYVPSKTTYWYFAIDTKKPAPNGTLSEDTSARTTSSVKVNLPSKAVDVKTYKLMYKESNAFEWEPINLTTETEYELTGLTAGTKYEIMESWTDRAGQTASSNTVTACTLPNTPVITTVRDDSDKRRYIKVSWDPVEGGCKQYKVYYKIISSYSYSNNYDVETLDKTKNYCHIEVEPIEKLDIYVTAVSNNIESEKSNVMTEVIPPENVTNVTFTGKKRAGAPEFTITWDRPAEPREYETLTLYFMSLFDHKTLMIDISNPFDTTNNVVLNYVNMSRYYDPDGEFGELQLGVRYSVRIESEATLANGEVIKASDALPSPSWAKVD